MTLANLLQPTISITLHAQLKGFQFGATLATLLSLPTLTLSPTSKPTLIAASKFAGVGATTGATLATLIAIAKLSKTHPDGIRTRHQKLINNSQLRLVKNVTVVGATCGLALAATRVVRIADEARVSTADVMCTLPSAWDAFCLAALGAAVGLMTTAVVNKLSSARSAHRDVDGKEVPDPDTAPLKEQ